jgi:hypothetical protein
VKGADEIMVDQAPSGRGRIFISYRREETAYPAGWLFDKLAERFGEGQIFKDIDSIEPGDDFVDTITAAVGSCDVLLALIGNRWLTITDAAGTRRLDDPNDFVRVEVEAALSRNVRVIPVLVEGASPPRGDQLPATLAGLVRRQALELSPSRFETDLGRLLRVLEKTLAETHAGATRPETARTADGRAPTLGSAESRSSSTAGDVSSHPIRRLFSTPRRIAAAAAVVLILLVVLAVAVIGHKSSPPGDDSPSSDEPGPSEEGSWPAGWPDWQYSMASSWRDGHGDIPSLHVVAASSPFV